MVWAEMWNIYIEYYVIVIYFNCIRFIRG